MSTPHLRLVRLSDDGSKTLGVLEVYRRRNAESPLARFFTVERPWKDNATRVSCIPTGVYRLERRRSERFGLHLHVRGTEPARSLILIHAGNDVKDVVGCVAIGTGTADIDGDGDLEVTTSAVAVKRLLELVPESGATDAVLEVTNCLHVPR